MDVETVTKTRGRRKWKVLCRAVVSRRCFRVHLASAVGDRSGVILLHLSLATMMMVVRKRSSAIEMSGRDGGVQDYAGSAYVNPRLVKQIVLLVGWETWAMVNMLTPDCLLHARDHV